MKNQDQLNVLKKTWKNSNFKETYVEHSELYKIIQLNSNSIVKRIFIISLIEFSLSFLPFFLDGKKFFTKEIFIIQNSKIMLYLDYLYYSIFIFFIVQFYINFKKINTNSNLNKLSKNILKTRKSVYNYIYISLIIFNLNSIVFAYLFLESNFAYKQYNTNHSQNNQITFQIIFYSILILFLSLITYSIWLIYKSLYLKLIKKLNQNYNELNS
jgi:hypothetical protein